MCNCEGNNYQINMGCCVPVVANPNIYYTKSEIDEKLSGITTEGISEEKAQELIDDSLEDYYTKDEIDAAFDSVNDELDGKLDASAYTPTDLTDYATKEWVENKNYLTEHQHLKTINNISLVGDGNIEIGSGGTTDLSNYYTKSETNNLLDDKLDASAYTPTDLTNYYNKTEVDNLLLNKANASDLSALTTTVGQLSTSLENKADKSEIPSLSGYATEQWVQNQGYLTQHQSLSGYATEQWVENQGYLTQHQSLDNYYPKSVVDALISGLQAQIDELTTALSECCTGQTGQTQARIGAVIFSTAANAIMDVGSEGEIERIVIESGGTYYPSATLNDAYPMPKAGNNRANIYLVSGTTTLGLNSKWESSAINYNFSGATDVTRIGQNCFKNSPYLQTLTLPSSVTSIADHAFDDCPSLARLNILAETPPTLEYYAQGYDAIKTLMTGNANVVVYVPSTALSAYRSATGWSAYSSRIEAIS